MVQRQKINKTLAQVKDKSTGSKYAQYSVVSHRKNLSVSTRYGACSQQMPRQLTVDDRGKRHRPLSLNQCDQSDDSTPQTATQADLYSVRAVYRIKQLLLE